MKKIIIVGGGIAGLSAGIYGQRAGFETVIYEKNPVAGGNCSGWARGSYYIDNCIHWMTGTKSDTPQYKVWEELGALTEDTGIIKRDSFYTSELNGKTITLWRDLDRTQEEMLALSPEDEKEIRRFIEYTRLGLSLQNPDDDTWAMVRGKREWNLSISRTELVKTLLEWGNRPGRVVWKIQTSAFKEAYAGFYG